MNRPMHRHPTTILSTAALVLALGSTACGGDDGDEQVVVRDDITCAATPSTDLMVRIEERMGYSLGEGSEFAQRPEVVLYADGRLLVEREDDNTMVVTMLSCDEVRDVLADVRAVGLTGEELDVDNDELQERIADANSTSFEIDVEPRAEVSVYALSSSDGVSAAARERRADLTSLRDDLVERGRGGDPYEPATHSAFVERYDVALHEPRDVTITWPLGALPSVGDEIGRCIPLTSDDVERVEAARNGVDGPVAWESGGERLLVWTRPDLPHESSCAGYT